MMVRKNRDYLVYTKEAENIGTIYIVDILPNFVLGRFDKAPAFSKYAGLFMRYEEAINSQMLSIVDGIEAEVDSLGIYIKSVNEDDSHGIMASDVQIFSGKAISFNLKEAI